MERLDLLIRKKKLYIQRFTCLCCSSQDGTEEPRLKVRHVKGTCRTQRQLVRVHGQAGSGAHM